MIDTELAAFLQEGIAIEFGTRDAQLEPHGTSVIAVAVDDSGQHVVAYVRQAGARRILPNLEANGQAAIVFSRPPDERACQIKGTFAGSWTATADERPFVEAQWDRWLDRLASIGLDRAVFGHWPSWPCVAVRVRVQAIFNQTPGPGAGGRIV